MKPPRLLPLLCFLSAALGLAAAAPERFEKTRTRMDALLDRHRKAEPLPAKPANPFLFMPPAGLAAGPVGGPPGIATGPVQPPTPELTAAALADDDQILAYCVARLRITGQVQRGGVAHLMINSATYRAGDLIPVHGSGDAVYYIKVAKVAPTEVVFGYNDAVLTIPLKG